MQHRSKKTSQKKKTKKIIPKIKNNSKIKIKISGEGSSKKIMQQINLKQYLNHDRERRKNFERCMHRKTLPKNRKRKPVGVKKIFQYTAPVPTNHLNGGQYYGKYYPKITTPLRGGVENVITLKNCTTMRFQKFTKNHVYIQHKSNIYHIDVKLYQYILRLLLHTLFELV